jgi:hypothetical protein
VVETLTTLQLHGFTFARVASRGFETLVAPCTLPPLEQMAPALWGLSGFDAGLNVAEEDDDDDDDDDDNDDDDDAPSSEDGVPTALRLGQHVCRVDAPPRSMLLAEPQVWQRAHFEAACRMPGEAAFTQAADLKFALARDGRRFGGFLMWNRLLFAGDEVLDTRQDANHWGAVFVPFQDPRRHELAAHERRRPGGEMGPKRPRTTSSGHEPRLEEADNSRAGAEEDALSTSTSAAGVLVLRTTLPEGALRPSVFTLACAFEAAAPSVTPNASGEQMRWLQTSAKEQTLILVLRS